MPRAPENQTRGNTGDPTTASLRSLWEACSECGDLRQDPAALAEDSATPRFMATAGPLQVLGPERLESGGERAAIREGLGPLVLRFWTRGKASRGSVARELGEERGGSCNGSVGQVGEERAVIRGQVLN